MTVFFSQILVYCLLEQNLISDSIYTYTTFCSESVKGTMSNISELRVSKAVLAYVLILIIYTGNNFVKGVSLKETKKEEALSKIKL